MVDMIQENNKIHIGTLQAFLNSSNIYLNRARNNADENKNRCM